MAILNAIGGGDPSPGQLAAQALDAPVAGIILLVQGRLRGPVIARSGVK